MSRSFRRSSWVTAAALIALLVVCLLTAPGTGLAQDAPALVAHRGQVGPPGPADAPASSTWDIQCVVCLPHTLDLGNRSLALDSAGRPHISYVMDDANMSLKYAWWTGDTWEKQTVDSTGAWDCSLALDSAGHPSISYTSASLDQVRYAAWTGSAWNIQVVADGKYPALALGNTGQPHLAYIHPPTVEWGEPDLHYARWTGTSWEQEVVDQVADVGLW